MESSEFERQLLEKVGYSLTTLQLRNYIVDMEIGVLQEEQGVTQRIRFDVDIFISGAAIPDEDEIDRVLDYDFIRGKINEKISGVRTNLLESLVGDLLDSLLLPFEAVAASVTATKLDVYEDGSEIGCKMMRLKD
uniref:Dihydroneopterin aldolase n=2 Tax=environmental samples TaxID=68359 RepID=A0A075H3J0_9EURY|nr:Dihydroneopterin aldolase [uncultured marine group II/III euryarchaeote AD1000_16_A02]AIF09077.1 Dihydroneopterin aldolase [uncultured marine group II/III euryarchaeote KM3_34_C09]MBC8517529.1 dihydroneopterin aldolase [Euryarchaeota archaeon]